MLSKSILKPIFRTAQNSFQHQIGSQLKKNTNNYFRPICSKAQKYLEEQTPSRFRSNVLRTNPDITKEVILAGYKKDQVEIMTDEQVLFYMESRLTDEEFKYIQNEFDIEAIRKRITKENDTDLEDVRIAINSELYRMAIQCRINNYHWITVEENGKKIENPKLEPISRQILLGLTVKNYPRKPA